LSVDKLLGFSPRVLKSGLCGQRVLSQLSQ